MLPIVTGNKFLYRKFCQVKFTISGALPNKVVAASITLASFLTNSPIGIKYIFATECSNPIATNAVIGNIIENILSTTLLPEKQSHTARQTSVLHIIPRTSASVKVRLTLALDRKSVV